MSSYAHHAASGLLAVGFSGGVFDLYSLPDFANLHTLSVGQERITSLAFNDTGDWLAGAWLGEGMGCWWGVLRIGACATGTCPRGLPCVCNHSPWVPCLRVLSLAVGCARLGQLLVWEWRSETYVLKQQGHYHDITTTAFSPDGALIATGADDCKVGAEGGRAPRPAARLESRRRGGADSGG